MKSSSLAYNCCETRDKGPLGRDPDRSSCHLHTSVKPFWSQPMAPWILAAAYECAAAQTKKALHQCGGDTSSCLGLYSLTVSHQWQARPITFHLAHMLLPMPMEPWTATKKALSYSQCGGDTSSCPIFYPMATCPKFHVGQGRTFHLVLIELTSKYKHKVSLLVN